MPFAPSRKYKSVSGQETIEIDPEKDIGKIEVKVCSKGVGGFKFWERQKKKVTEQDDRVEDEERHAIPAINDDINEASAANAASAAAAGCDPQDEEKVAAPA